MLYSTVALNLRLYVDDVDGISYLSAFRTGEIRYGLTRAGNGVQ